MKSTGDSRASTYTFLSFAGIAIVTGVACAIHLRWATDDAFISFRFPQILIGRRRVPAMKVLLLNQFFYPDSAATSQLLTDLARGMAAAMSA